MRNGSRLLLILGVMSLFGGVGGSAYALNKKIPAKLLRWTTEESAERREIRLAAGEQRIVDLDHPETISKENIFVGNPGLVAVDIVRVGTDTQLVFKPIKPGETTVILRDEKGAVPVIFDVRVDGSSVERMLSEVKELLKDVEGIRIRIIGKKIIVDGELIVPSDFGRVHLVATDENYKEVVTNLVQLSPLSLQLVAQRIQKDVQSFAPQVTARVVNSQIWLEGTVEDAGKSKRALRIAELYLPEASPEDLIGKDRAAPVRRATAGRAIIQNFLVINPPPPKKQDKLVRVTMHFVELSKDYVRLFGFKWQPGFTADPTITIGQTDQGGAGASGAASFTATISSLFPKLNSAQQAGYARILKSATVLVRSGLPAQIKDQTEIPVIVQGAQAGQVQVTKEPIGIDLSVTPLILGQSDDIELKIKMEQKSKVGDTGSAPIVSNHSVNTTLYVKSTESAAIAGVNAADIQTNFNKNDPNSGGFQGNSTSPFFTLLRTKGYTKKKGQFVIFVTPQIVNDASEGTEDLKKNFRVKVR